MGLRSLSMLVLISCVASFPSYIPCASDVETLLKLGTHTCSRALGKMGSAIDPAQTHATLTATSGNGKTTATVGRGETVTVTLKTKALDGMVGESVWMVARVSDAGANGTLHGDSAIFEAVCSSQMSSMGPSTQASTPLVFRAPCDAVADITITVVHSRCNEGCSTGAIASGLITPGQFYLNELKLTVRSDVDPSCAKPAPPPQPGMQDICQPTTCWEGDGCDEVSEVPLKAMPITVSRWDSVKNQYKKVGTANAFTMSDTRWGSLLHGPTRLGGNASAKAIPGYMPPVYVSVDSSNSIYRIDNITFDGMSAASTRAAWVAAPASQQHIMENGRLKAMVVSSGQPFGDTIGPNNSHMITQGGVYSISPEGCHKLWPNKLDSPERIASGGVVNRIVCHDASGVCFFSNWNHEFNPNMDATSHIPHCAHWCALDDPTNPTACGASEPLAGGPQNAYIPGRFCSEPQTDKNGTTVWVAPHGMLIGEAVLVGDTWQLELIMSFSDGLQSLDTGVSFARKMFITVQRNGLRGEGTKVNTTHFESFGTELTTDTLGGTPYDVRLDHMWKDAEGYVWFSTFGLHNTGEHVLDYKTGKLLVSYQGFEQYPHTIKPYNPSGISIVGGFGEPGAVAVVLIETVPPLPIIHGVVVFVDISNGWGLV